MAGIDLRTIADALYSVGGDNALDELVGSLTKILGVDYALVSQLVSPDTSCGHTLSYFADGKKTDNFEYDLAGGPCMNVQSREACTFNGNVQQIFPEDSGLKERGVEAYIGIPLLSSSDAPIGIIAVMNRTPLDDVESVRDVLQLFAARAANELDWRQREAELKHSEAKFRNLVEGSIQGVYIHKDMHLLFVNRAFAEMLGYESPEALMVDRSLLRLFHPDEHERILGFKDRRLAGQDAPSHYEVRLLRRDGTVVWLENNAHVIEWEGEPAFQSTNMDITERKWAEFALQRTTKKLEEAQRLAHVGHWEWDPDSKKSEWSEELFRIFGLDPEDEPSTSQDFMRNIVHQADRPALEREMADTLRTGNPYTTEFRIVRPDGEVRTVFEHSERYVPEETGRPRIRGVLQDITELKQAEGNLREISRRLELAQKQAKVGYWRWSFEEERLTYWSEEAAQISQYPLDTGLKNYEETLAAIHPDDRPRVEAEYKAADEEYRDFSLEYRVVHKDGRITHIREIGEVEHDGSGVPVAHVGFVQDITELKQMEEELRKSERRLNAFFEEAPAGLTLYDREGRYIKVNETIARINGTPAEAHIGKRPSEILPPALGQEIEEANWRTMETGGKLVNVEISAVIPTARTEVSHYVYSRFPISSPEGARLGVGAVIVDITERKRAEEELASLNAELEQRVDERTVALHAAQEELVRSERLATLGQLTATVSHELRNPLGSMRTSMYVIERGNESQDERLLQSIARVNRNITRCDQIIDELLDYTRIRNLNIHNITIDDWLGTFLDEQPVPEGVRIQRKFGAGIVVPADTDRLRRAVVNVYDNACQAMTGLARDNGPQRKLRLTVQTRIRNDRAEIIYTDNGSGIPEDKIERIFEPLFSTKSFGVGLGLPVVRQIMEQHGGGVEVDKKRSGGAKFTLWLPLEPGG